MSTQQQEAPSPDQDPLWYKDAIIYQVHVRAFYDSDGDGIGDFRGLTQKLDYLQDLGVTAVWLLPFYPSPLKDDGYDIADYNKVNPDYGTLQDFRLFMREARRRGIHVITELVINHTSDQHPWFQRARRAKPGSRHRDMYVWSETPERYSEARIIFKDFETSNWAWDPIAQSYFWHRFYSHQPDLNFESPATKREIFRALDFWLDMGVSGLRLDAVPYLFELEGTNCENLPETHSFLRELRAHVDARFKDRMLLAEANQWPEDAVEYFGNGDECHMAFHFPLMPRMFMAVRMESRLPIVDIMEQTPPIPDNSQWALFLRNHDELTLEMVTDEERDYMYRVYAHDPHARINLGIRRRLAPLLGNDRRKVELLNSLLFSLPGAPVVYYGDEIGMGDNFYLGDRNGVRTPMQWSADRNGGFSRATPQKLYMPVIMDPEYHYEAVNVETHQNNTDSLLWWMKRIIAARKRFNAFSRGSLRFLNPENRKVLAFIREHQDESILVVANLSRFPQHVSLDLDGYRGRALVEAFGGGEFPPVGEEPYFLTLGPYSFYWLLISPISQELAESRTRPLLDELPVLTVAEGLGDLFRKQNRVAFGNALAAYIRKQRWFGGKGRRVQGIDILDVLPLSQAKSAASLVLVRVDYSEGEPETYTVPLAVAAGEEVGRLFEEVPNAIVARLMTRTHNEALPQVIYDALAEPKFCAAILDAFRHRRRFKGNLGALVTSPTRVLRQIVGPEEAAPEPEIVNADQSNTSVVYGDKLFLKVFRRLGEGTNPDYEIGRFLSDKGRFPHTPPIAGALEYKPSRDGETMTVGILQGYVHNEGNVWSHTLDAIGHFFERALAHEEHAPSVSTDLLAMSEQEPSALALETIGPYLASAHLLGQRTAEMHNALASDSGAPDFVPEPFSILYQRSIYHAMRSYATDMLQLLRQRLSHIPDGLREDAQKVVDLGEDVVRSFRALQGRRIDAMRIRCHGDYHLGQVLYTGTDFVIIDFEGEPARPLSERRLKRSPLRDVAGMLRSFHYASYAALSGQAPVLVRPEDVPSGERWAEFWYQWVSATFLKSYLEVTKGQGLLPDDSEDLRTLLHVYLLEKAVYEIGYEINNRPEWLKVPLSGVLHLMRQHVK